MRRCPVVACVVGSLLVAPLAASAAETPAAPAPAAAADPAAPAGAVPVAEAAPEAEGAPPALKFATGEVTLGEKLAKLTVPEGMGYLDPDQAEVVLVELWGNPKRSRTLGMLAPLDVNLQGDAGWAVVIQYIDDGHVADDDAAEIDYEELLEEMKESIAESNEERKKEGYSTLTLVGWAEKPHYEAATKKLFWARELRFDDQPDATLNYDVRVLGAEGILSLNAVAGMAQLAQVKQDMQRVLPAVEFLPGERYEDFDPSTGRLAAYGVGGLVAGKVAAKAGLFKVLLGGILAAKKFLIAGLVAVGALLTRLFRRKAE